MSGITLDDLANDAVDYSGASELPVLDFEGEYDQQVIRDNRAKEIFSKVFAADTGEGSIESYLDHPLNFNNSKGLAQMLRGLTGITGNLKLAIVDVIFGFLRFSKEKKGVISHLPVRGSDVS
jgi:hypothetical protein